jgi:YD repeat-containing protein
MEDAMYLGGERFHGKWVTTLEESGKVAERSWQNRDGVVEVTEHREYDEAERLIARTRGNVAAWRYRYDSEGRLAGVTGGYHSDDEPSDTEMEYDDDGRLIRETRSFADGTVHSVTRYEYAERDPAAS